MENSRPQVAILCNKGVYDRYIQKNDLDRLRQFADCKWMECIDGQPVTDHTDTVEALFEFLNDADGLIVSHGAPGITATVLERASKLRIIGDMDGDRFAGRIDVETAWARGIRTVDTTNGTSYPVSEWALALIIISLRNAGLHFRNILAGSYGKKRDDPGLLRGDLTGKRVGLIGCGHIGRRLIQFLHPFETDIYVYDPYLPKEMADALGFTQTSLDNVLTMCEVIVCLVPLTPRTRGMIGRRELDLIPSGSVFVNVTRGAVVDSDALIARLKRGDIIAGLDVFDPEPIPLDSEITHLPNVFLSPHIAGVTVASYPRMFSLMVDEFDRFFHGHETRFDLTPRSIANRRGTDFSEV